MQRPQPQVVTSKVEYLASSMIIRVARAVVPNALITVTVSKRALKMAAIRPKQRVSTLSSRKFHGNERRAESTQMRIM